MRAWLDRPSERRKDLDDLAMLFERYVDEVDPRRFDGEVVELGLQFEQASPYLLDKDLGRVTSTSERELVRSFLRRVKPGQLEHNQPFEHDHRGAHDAFARALKGGGEDASQWLRALAHLAPDEAADWFDVRKNDDATQELFVSVSGWLEMDFEYRGDKLGASQFFRWPSLERWIPLLMAFLRMTDVPLDGTIELRHRAQDLRDRWVRPISRDSSLVSHQVLERLISGDAFAKDLVYARFARRQQRASAARACMPIWTGTSSSS